jgi:hypothetical protein
MSQQAILFSHPCVLSDKRATPAASAALRHATSAVERRAVAAVVS